MSERFYRVRVVLPGVWKATGRWRVRRYGVRFACADGQPGWRWAVVTPAGGHLGHALDWATAYRETRAQAQLEWREP